jgi:hypothetical protein
MITPSTNNCPLQFSREKLKVKKIIILTFILSMIITFFYANDSMSNQNNFDAKYNGIIVKIDLANPKIYQQNDDIFVNVKIFNSSSDEKYMVIADEKRFSFDFKMVTMQNREIEHSSEYIISFHRVQPIFNSQIRLAPNEAYIYEVRLNDYFDLNITGQYFVKCLYYPELKLNNSINGVINSNQLSINIRPESIKEEIILEEKAIEEEKKYFVSKRSPDEVVAFTLNSRMKEEWNKFFLYLDLEKLIQTNNYFKQKYIKADVERQRELIAQYKSYLKKNTIDEISFLPTKFEIIKTEYTSGRGKVDAIIYYRYQDYYEKKYYTFFLNKKGNIWYIYSYEVMNLGAAK